MRVCSHDDRRPTENIFGEKTHRAIVVNINEIFFKLSDKNFLRYEGHCTKWNEDCETLNTSRLIYALMRLNAEE